MTASISYGGIAPGVAGRSTSIISRVKTSPALDVAGGAQAAALHDDRLLLVAGHELIGRAQGALQLARVAPPSRARSAGFIENGWSGPGRGCCRR